MVYKKLSVAAWFVATACLSACGGGGGGNATTTTPVAAPLATANSVTVSGATGGQAANNGVKTVAGIAATASTRSSITYTNVTGTLGAASDRISVVFVTATGAVTDVSLHFGATPTLPNYLSAVCGPCTGVTVSTTAKTITFAATAVNNGATPPLTQATLDGVLAF